MHSNAHGARSGRFGDGWWGDAGTALIAALFLAAPVQAQSPPGRLLASPFGMITACNADGSNCLVVVNNGLEGGNLPADARDPSVANNGAIAFSAIYGVDGSCTPGGQGVCARHIFAMDADGANVRQLTANPEEASQFGGDTDPAMSPDGTMVAFVSNRAVGLDPNGNPSRPPQIFVVNIDGSGFRQVTPVQYDPNGNPTGDIQSLAWSPDGTTLAFNGIRTERTLCGDYFGLAVPHNVIGTIALNGTGETHRACLDAPHSTSMKAIDWSPDGTLIAYGRSTDIGDPAVAFIDLSGGGRFAAGLSVSQLGVSCGQSHCIGFSPDSNQLAYQNGSGNISTIHLDGTQRVDTAITFGNGLAWDARTVPAAAQVTLAPDPIELWPSFPQQTHPSVLDAAGDAFLHTAATFNIAWDYGVARCAQIGPYGLAMYNGTGNGRGAMAVTNAGLTSNGIEIKCWAAAPCTYALSINSETFRAAGGSDSVGVNTDPGTNQSTCPWMATSQAAWIGITSGSSGSGTNPVSFTVAANAGAARQGTMTIAGQTFTVNQDAAGPPAADLGLTKTGAPNPVMVGGTLTYTITVSNAGPSGATGVTVVDALRAGVSYVSATTSQGSCTGTSTVNCSLGSLANGGSAMVTIVVSATQAGSVSNTASVSGAEPDPNVANNSATAVTTVNAPPTMLTAVGPAVLWVGQNDSVKQLKLDLLAEVLVDGAVVASGQLSNVSAGGGDFSQAVLDTVSLALGSATPAPSGASLSLRASVRSSCSVRKAGNAGVARLWFDGQPIDAGKPSARDAGSRFTATIGGSSRTHFLRAAFALQTTAGTSRKFVDVAMSDGVSCPARPYSPFGTWSLALP